MTSCLICGLQLYQFAANDESLPWRKELSRRTEWWAEVRLLCDPDDEVGTLCPSLAYTKLDEQCTITLRVARTDDFRHRSEASDIEIHPAEYRDSGRYAVLNPDGTVKGVVFLNRRRNESRHTFDNRHYIPVHDVCLKMAEKLSETSPKNTRAFIKDTRGLCIALTWRFALGLKCHGPRREYPPNYVVGRSHFHLKWNEWRARWNGHSPFEPVHALPGTSESPNDNIPDVSSALSARSGRSPDVIQLWGTNPLEIEDLTNAILLSLQETPRQRPTNLERRLFSLPPEIIDMILGTVNFRDLPRVTTGFLSQKVWLDKLKSGCLPWLWDLDYELIGAKAREPCPGGEEYEWNWELLVRQLSRGVDFGIRTDVPTGTNPLEPIKKKGEVVRSDATFWETTGYHNDLQYVPPGLLNRRRIWQLLEELFVGDFIPQSASSDQGPKWVIKDYIALPWSKSGEVLRSPKWIPSFDLKPYVRRIDGKTYIIRGMIRPMQYWQDPGGFWKEHFKHLSTDYDGGANSRMRPPDGAPAKDVQKVLRRLRYPV
ncbi:hypothetical protein ACO1O0_002620 [Amphichorda felina]